MLRIFILLCCFCTIHAATSITQYGITWTFDKNYEIGQYCTGDYWVKGPVTVISISNDWHIHGFDPEPGHDGSMLNPGTGGVQGYDKRLNNYRKELNAALPNGKRISAENPLIVEAGSSLISSVSWLARSNKDKEPGCPRYNGGTKAPRPVLRDAAILTVVAEAPPEGSFRPAYCATDKSAVFNKNDLKYGILPTLMPPDSTPDIKKLAVRVRRPWIDHVHQYLGAMVHPTRNMPEYGRELSTQVGIMALALLVDFKQLSDQPEKEPLMIGFVQLGIDLAAIADHGGSWPSNGGHHMGRKWPILFAGLMLDNAHMKNVGQWQTGFQEDLDTFYVSQAEIDMTHSDKWKPDKRAKELLAYEEEHLGLPEWGIRHRKDPWADNRYWGATYRTINNQSYAGFVLAAHIMGQKQAWNHEPLFDYVDRVTQFGSAGRPPGKKGHVVYTYGNQFVHDMWQAYRRDYGCYWKVTANDMYSTGALTCEQCKHYCPNGAQTTE